MSPIHFLRSVPFALVLAAASTAQGPDSGAESFGVTSREGRVRAAGPGYVASFDPRGIEFAAQLAGATASDHGVRFTLTSVRRGAATVFDRTTDTEPVVAGDRVSYAHGADLAEVYDARQDGIEQSFVFAQRPVGVGDLVVRGAIATELPIVAASDSGVRYEQEGRGAVTFGAVTGVDANGATARGSIRAAADGKSVEWVLPAAFVDHAAYPLVLDPLIAPAFSIGSSAVFDARVRVAFDDSTNRYLAVWTAQPTIGQPEVRGQMLGPTGTPIGSYFVLSSNAVQGDPSVANVNSSNRFLVTWTELVPAFTVVVARGVGASSATLSPPVTVFVAGNPNVVDQPVVGGDSRPTGSTSDYACIVYRVSGPTPRLECRGLQVPPTTNPVLVGSPQTVASGFVGYQSITLHAGSAGNWITAWAHGSSAAGPYQHVSCRVIGAFGVPCSAVTPVSIGFGAASVRNTSCATPDGHEFVVAWEDAVAKLVRVRPFVFTGSCPGTFSTGLSVAPVVAPGTQSQPAIEFAKEKYLLAWHHNDAGAISLRMKSLLPATCASCGTESVVSSGGSATFRPTIGARWSGGDVASDEAMIGWTSSGVLGRLCEATGNDTVVTMGGGCVSGLNDFATYSGDAVLGNANFQLSIAGSVSLPLVLIVGFSAVSAPCGNCTIVPSPDILFPATNPYTLAIPCDPLLVGADIYTQWLVLKPSTCPILPDFSFTNALKITIGE